MHFLRCSPCFDYPLLNKHDAVLRKGLSAIVNIHMSDTQWIQASTPVRNGGLGIRRASSLAFPAFLASAAATSDLQCSILSRFQLFVEKEVSTARTFWRSLIDTPAPLGPLESSQRAWDAPLLARDLRSVEEAASSPLDRAKLLAATAVLSLVLSILLLRRLARLSPALEATMLSQAFLVLINRRGWFYSVRLCLPDDKRLADSWVWVEAT